MKLGVSITRCVPGLVILATLLGHAAVLASQPIIQTSDVFKPRTVTSGMVACSEPLAAEAALQVLKEGGNAVDAAVTAAFTLAVTLPRAGNLGGGGFMLLHDAQSDQTHALDYRETAPAASSRDMFLDEKGNPDDYKSRYSILASGVPGTVRGLAAALEHYGTISLQRALQPAYELASTGFPVYDNLHDTLKKANQLNRLSDEAKRVYFVDGKRVPEIGEVLIQPDLAATILAIQTEGPDAFYTGTIANKIASYMKSRGGLITKDDLAAYAPILRKPVVGEYRGYEILSMPPPSSGGAHIIQILNLMEPYPIGVWGHNDPRSVHVFVEAMKLAYADRSKHLGDPAFYDVPIRGLTSKAYAGILRNQINEREPTPSSSIEPGHPGAFFESNETTHISVVDQWGNAVANTYTLNFSYGSGHMVPGTGILLNNQMDDFSAKVGAANAYGLIGGEANSIEPSKRMLSSMSPTIVLDNQGEVFLVTGSPGGSKIITTVVQIISNVLDHRMNPAEAVLAYRFHHQWLPDVLEVESGFPSIAVTALIQKGYQVKTTEEAIGAAHTILRSNGRIYGAADLRRAGATVVGY